MHTFKLMLVLLLIPWSGIQGQVSTGSATVQLHAGDAVRLQAGREPMLNGDYPISEDGRVLLPLIGFVLAADRSFSAVRSEIEERYGDELVDSPLLVTPIMRIAVLGEVQQPGLFPVDPTMTFSEVIASAGGLTARGDPEKLTVLREGREIPLRLGAKVGPGSSPLLPGDQILVGRQGWFRENVGVVLTAGATVVAAALTSLILSSR